MNERDVANGFSALWSEHFPMLSPTFIMAFNESFVCPIFGRAGIVEAVQAGPRSAGADLLAEFAFRLAAAANAAGMSVNTAAADKSISESALAAAADRIYEFRPELNVHGLSLEEPERQEGVRLAVVYEEFFSLWPTERIAFSPAIKGSGILGSCFADLAIGRTLYEVKTVSRPFHSCDLRQLLVYLALESVTGEHRWDYGGLFNPRSGRFCRVSLDWLVTRLSGGRPPKIVFADFVQALVRDSELDRRF